MYNTPKPTPFQVLENTEFTDVRPLFPPLMHVVCLVYSNSTYYSSAARIIVLLQVKELLEFGYCSSLEVGELLEHGYYSSTKENC